MFKLISERNGTRYEENFLAAEQRTAVEIARDRLEKGYVVVLRDERLVKADVAVILPADLKEKRIHPIAQPSVNIRVSALTVIDLSKLPRRSKTKSQVKLIPLASLRQLPQDAPAKPTRVSKRQRKFGPVEKATV